MQNLDSKLPSGDHNTSSPTSHFITLRNGLQQHVLVWPANNADSKHKTPCILMHGFTNDAHVWDQLAELLCQQRTVYALDFRGHGDSDWDPQADYNHYSLMDDLHDTVQALGLEHYSLVAHSLGARIAMLYVAHYQANLSGLVIMDTGPEVGSAGVNKVREDVENMPVHFPSVEAYADHLAGIYLLASRDDITQLLARHGLKRLDSGDYIPKTDPAFTAALWNPQSKHRDTRDLRMPLNEQLWAALATIQAPTLLIRGQLSAILSRHTARKMVEEVLPSGRLCTIPRAGHALMLDNPSVVCKEILQFMSTLP